MKIKEIKNGSKEYYNYIEKYILPNEYGHEQIKYFKGTLEYDYEYIYEHMKENKETNYKLIE